MIWLLTVSCRDASNNPATLYFSNGYWDDKTKLIYQNRLLQPALINRAANDGSVLQLFKESSIGEIELCNADGGLDFMSDYAFDGRSATLNNGTTSYDLGVIVRMSERNNSLFFSFKSLSELLTNPYPQETYNSATDSPAWDSSLDGQLKPIVFGQCKNITPVLVDPVRNIYQTSSEPNCRIVAVYYNGERLTNYLVNGVSTGATIPIDSGVKGFKDGQLIMFDGDDSIYTVFGDFVGTSGTLVVTDILDVQALDNVYIDHIDTNISSAPFWSLADLITDSEKLYTDATKKAVKWGSFQGYFYLVDAAQGVITCDVITVNEPDIYTQGKIYNVIEDVISGCGIAGLTVDTTTQVNDYAIYGAVAGNASKHCINLLGYAGFYITKATPIKTILDSLVKSFCGYYWFDGSELQIKILDAPKSTATETINEYQITGISREATGLGNNGLPIKGWLFKYRKNYTVMTTVASILSTDQKELLGKDFQEIEPSATEITTESNTLDRHPLSEKKELESLLINKTKARLVYAHLCALGSTAYHIVNVTVSDIRLLDTLAIGQTFEVITPLLGYTTGKKLLCVGIEFNAAEETLLIRGFG